MIDATLEVRSTRPTKCEVPLKDIVLHRAVFKKMNCRGGNSGVMNEHAEWAMVREESKGKNVEDEEVTECTFIQII